MLPLLRPPARASGAAATPHSAAVACLAAAVALAGPPARGIGQEPPDSAAVGAPGAREGRDGAPGGLPRSGSADGVGRPASGELHPELTSVADSTQRYALYLPPEWDGSSRRPLLLVMDPRGRAVAALERFREGARRHGWVVMSSHDTRSDTDEPEANRRAVNAMLTDASSHLSVDPDRIYLAGFSGTARLAWLYARELSPHVAGTVAVGAGLPLWKPAAEGEGAPPLPDHFAFWGGSGRLDFNYAEVRRLDGLLDSLGIRHRVAHYEGPHAWLPAEQALRATDWLELAAMRHGLAPVDRPFVDSLRVAWIRRARREAAGGDTAAALEAWRAVAEDLAGLAPVAEARRRADALEATDAIRRRRELREAQAREQRSFGRRLRSLLERMESASAPPEADAAAELGLDRLRERRAGADREDALQAGRLLELVYVQASFYVPLRALEAGKPARALAALELAERAVPGRARTCWFRARAHALAGRSDAALDALACARRRGPLPRSLLEGDPWLAPLRDHPRWDEVAGPP